MSMTNSCSEANRIAVIYDWRVLSLRVTNLDSMFGADEWCLGRSGCVSTKDEHLNVGRRGSRGGRQLRQSQTAVAADDRGSCGRRSLTEEIVIMRDGVIAASSIEYRHKRTSLYDDFGQSEVRLQRHVIVIMINAGGDAERTTVGP